MDLVRDERHRSIKVQEEIGGSPWGRMRSFANHHLIPLHVVPENVTRLPNKLSFSANVQETDEAGPSPSPCHPGPTLPY